MRHENPEQRLAFEVYYSLGPSRSIEKLHSKYLELVNPDRKKPPTLQTLFNWSKWFNWQERIRKREQEVGIRLAEVNTELAVKSAEDILKLLVAELRTAFDEKLRPRFPLQSARDVNETIRLILQVLGVHEQQSQENVQNWTNIKVIKIVTSESRRSREEREEEGEEEDAETVVLDVDAK
ncbi:MAG: hypothetical protein DRP85_05505 [Candidatus Makaraimicrobium thalassicum]|nr:MAG: hypothetical protein DRP85_05505 [Candidatus Omnitrophota bacterium]